MILAGLKFRKLSQAIRGELDFRTLGSRLVEVRRTIVGSPRTNILNVDQRVATINITTTDLKCFSRHPSKCTWMKAKRGTNEGGEVTTC